MKPAQETAAAQQVKVWALSSNGKHAGQVVAVWAKSGAVTVTLTRFNEGRVSHLTSISRGGGYDKVGAALERMFYKTDREASDQFGAGSIESGFKLLGLDCWQVL